MTLSLVARTVRPWRWRWALAAALGAAALGCSVALMATAAWLIATAAGHPPVLTLLVAVVAVRTFGIGRGVLRYAERLLSHDAALRVIGAIRSSLVAALTRSVQAGATVGRRSGLLSFVVTDSHEMADILLRGLLPLIAAGTVGAAAVLLAWSVFPLAGVVLAGCLLDGCVLAPIVTARRTIAVERQTTAVRARRDEILAETIDQINDLVAIGAFPAALEQLSAIDRTEGLIRRASARAAGWGAVFGVLTSGVAVLLTAVVATPAVSAGRLGSAWLAVLVLTPLALTEMVTAVHDSATALARSAAAGRRLSELLPRASRTGQYHPAAEPTPVEPAPAGHVGTVRLRGVSARWPGAAADSLTGVDLDLEPGGRIVVFGESGSGKSTLAAVLVGLLAPTAGTISVDGRPMGSLVGSGLASWADQRAHLFDTSIRENVRLARPECSAADLELACAEAGLGDWLAGLPDGLDSSVGEHGLAISGGQRQRIALARAFLAGRALLVADEVAAHLDEPTAVAVTAQVMRPDRAGCVLLITHRPDDMRWGDSVFRMDHGRLSPLPARSISAEPAGPTDLR